MYFIDVVAANPCINGDTCTDGVTYSGNGGIVEFSYSLVSLKAKTSGTYLRRTNSFLTE